MKATTILNQLKLFAWTVIAEALSSRTLLSVAIIYLVSIALSLFIGEVAIIETKQSQSGITAAFLRLAILFFLALFTINSLVREMNDRMLLLYLSMPISRSIFILGKFLGFAILGAVFSLLAACILSIYADFYPSFLWGVSLMLESCLVIGFSLLCAYSFAQVTTAFSAVSAIYILSRMMSALLLMAKNPLRGSQDSISQYFIQSLLTILDYLLPRLDRFTRSEWVMYGKTSFTELNFVFQQAIVYILLLLSIAFVDFYRKNI